MKKFFKNLGLVWKWLLRIVIVGGIGFFVFKFIQGKFYYEPPQAEKVSSKQDYLSSVKAPAPDTLVDYIPLSRGLITKADSAVTRFTEGDSLIAKTLPDSLIPRAPKKVETVLGPPNIILIVMDDMGYGDLSAYGNKAIQTPTIDTLAKQGIMFDQYYTVSSESSPARASLLTGRYPIRTGVTRSLFPGEGLNTTYQKAVNVAQGLMEDEITIAEPLKKAGYATSLVGKWHLGDKHPHLPNNFGFDNFLGVHVSHDMEPMHLYRNDEIILEHPLDATKLIDSYTKEAVSFIGEQGENPFFLCLAHSFPHSPLYEAASIEKSQGGTYGDIMQEIDRSVKKVWEAVMAANVQDNTIIIITSDNGPDVQGSTGGLRGRKHEVFEGGIRVPFIMWAPRLRTNKHRINEPIASIDIFPTIMGMVGIASPSDRIIDGKNIMPLILDPQATSMGKRNIFYFWQEEPLALRHGDHKYHLPHRIGRITREYAILEGSKEGPFLFNISTDAEEAYNLVDVETIKGEEMKKQIEDFKQTLGSESRGWLQ